VQAAPGNNWQAAMSCRDFKNWHQLLKPDCLEKHTGSASPAQTYESAGEVGPISNWGPQKTTMPSAASGASRPFLPLSGARRRPRTIRSRWWSFTTATLRLLAHSRAADGTFLALKQRQESFTFPAPPFFCAPSLVSLQALRMELGVPVGRKFLTASSAV